MNTFLPESACVATHHGGMDALGVAQYDFSTNSNACGPCPQALQQVQAADPSHYPDPHYVQLRAQLAAWHGVAQEQIVLGASASELIHRLLLAVQLAGVQRARVPSPAYGDYARQALALGMHVHYRTDTSEAEAALQQPALIAQQAAAIEWVCSPCSPQGRQDPLVQQWLAEANPQAACWRVLDAAYAPLRLEQSGTAWLDQAQLLQAVCWQLFSPNKSLGLTGVRAAYAIAPRKPEAEHAAQHWRDQLVRLQALAPSWPLGAHGEAMLRAWLQPPVQQWLQASREQLQIWKQQQFNLLRNLGWHIAPDSQANYCVAQPPWPSMHGSPQQQMQQRHALLAQLRRFGVKLRETDSMGLPGHVRISVQAPAAQAALAHAWAELTQTFSP